MKKIIVVCTSLLLMAIIMRWMSWPGSNLLLILSCSTLATVLFYFGLPEYKAPKVLLGSLLLAVAVVQGMFKMMWWPGVPMYLGISIVGVLSVFISFYLLWPALNQSEWSAHFKRALLFIFIFTGIVAFTPQSSIYYFSRIKENDKGIEPGHGAFNYFTYAEMLMEEGRLEDAQEAFERLQEYLPNAHLGMYHGGRWSSMPEFEEDVKSLGTQLNAGQ